MLGISFFKLLPIFKEFKWSYHIREDSVFPRHHGLLNKMLSIWYDTFFKMLASKVS